VVPGARATYYSAIANVPSGIEFWEPDDEGDWVDRATGKKWRKRKVDEGRGSGHGYTEVTVASADRETAVLQVRGYSFPKYEGPLALVGATSVVTIPGYGNDWWISPGVLERVGTGDFRGLKVLRMNHAIKGRTYRALRFQFDATSMRQELLTGLDGQVQPTDMEVKARQVLVYDLDSGILLFASTAGSGAKGTTLTQCTLEHVRALQVPWAGQAAPAWVAQTQAVEYTGAQVQPNPTGYGMPTSLPLTVTMTFLRRGADWAQYRLATSLASPLPALPPTVGAVDLVTGSTCFNGLWVPPAGLAALRPGQVLDRDPVTGVVTSVGQGEGNTVVLSEATSIQRIDCTYDRASGLMLQYAKTDFHVYNRQTVLRFARKQ
jgi:hypothetical protein